MVKTIPNTSPSTPTGMNIDKQRGVATLLDAPGDSGPGVPTGGPLTAFLTYHTEREALHAGRVPLEGSEPLAGSWRPSASSLQWGAIVQLVPASAAACGPTGQLKTVVALV